MFLRNTENWHTVVIFLAAAMFITEISVVDMRDELTKENSVSQAKLKKQNLKNRISSLTETQCVLLRENVGGN